MIKLKDKIPILMLFTAVFMFASCKDKKAERAQDSAEAETTYTNPLDVAFGDPYVLNDGNGMYYMYGTGGGAEDGFGTYSSADLIHWKYEGQVYRGNTEKSWAKKNFWAPEVYKKEGKYFMFFSADWKVNPNNELENFKIGIAISDSPTGPFKEFQDKPLFDPGYPIIDANVFQDKDGKYYLYYSRACYKHPVDSEIAEWAKKKGWFDEVEESWVYGVELKSDFSGVVGEPVLLLRPPKTMDDKNAEWESRSVTSKEVNRRWTEGSYTFEYNGTYYMMYSANYFGGKNYAVGYATAKSPLGPYTKAANNPILQKNTESGGEVTGTGHNSLVFLKNPDRIYCVYHARTKASGDQRVVFIDRMQIKKDGTLEVEGPSTTAQPKPL